MFNDRKQSNKSNSSIKMENLNCDVQLHLFSFFSGGELKNNRLVSKNFKDISDYQIEKLKKQTAQQIFYTPGEYILYSHWIPSRYPKMIYESIGRESIIASFPHKRTFIQLFETEALAAYERKFIESSKAEQITFFRPVFKVQYLSPSMPQPKWEKRHNRSVKYFDVYKDDVIPLEVRIETYTQSQWIPFYSINQRDENTNRCRNFMR